MSESNPRAWILAVVESAEESADTVCFLAADGWSVEQTTADTPPRLEKGHPPPIVLLDIDALGPALAPVVQTLRNVGPEIPMIATGREVAPMRRDLVRHLGLHGVYDLNEDPELLLALVESAAGLLARLRYAKEEQDLQNLLIAKLCHDLRGSLHAIRGYAEMLDAHDPAVDFDMVRERIEGISRGALEIAGGYLDLARLEQDGNAARRAPVDVGRLLSDLETDAKAQIGERAIEISTNVRAPGSVVHTDERKLQAILAELLANAIKFTAAGRVHLEVASDSGYTEFRVTDEGAGIDDPELLEGVTPFEQVRDALLAPVPGQGVGLAMALRLAEQLGGALDAKRAPTGGMAFRLLLPAESSATPKSTLQH